MNALLLAFERFLGGLPLPLLQVWGRLAYGAGAVLAIVAFGGFTFKPGGRWGLGRERQSWDARAILSIPLTFCLIIATGYLGSSIVLVPEAQTLESVKDLTVFLCVVLFGYPALITVPFAYALSDMIEGVPPAFVLHWLPGYFINPACFWIAYQLIGKDPDFRRLKTWRRYLLFAVTFMALEPALWGYICAPQFTPEISYRYITPALAFTTGLTWIMAPVAMLGALPLARRTGMFWAEIPGHVKERLLGAKAWVWEAGRGRGKDVTDGLNEGWPIRMLILAPFIALMLVMVGATAFVTLRSAEHDANKLAAHLHREIATNIDLLLDEHLARAPAGSSGVEGVSALLQQLPIARRGLALVLDRSGRPLASTTGQMSPVATLAVAAFYRARQGQPETEAGIQFRFDQVSARPLARTTWLANAAAYRDRAGEHGDWILLTVLPESYFLAGIKEGSSRSAVIFAVALMLSLAAAALLAAAVTRSLRRISAATRSLARGDLVQRVPGSRLEELDDLALSFNQMAEKLTASIEELRAEEQRLLHEKRLVDTLMDTLPGTVALVDAEGTLLKWNKALERVSGRDAQSLKGLRAADLLPADQSEAAARSVQAALARGYDESEFSVLTGDSTQVPYLFKSVRMGTALGPCILSVGFDMSDRRELEDRLRQAQKMEAIGSLAGGIAHDFNNLLTVILGFAELLRRRLEPLDPARGDADQIAFTAQRAAQLTRQLLAFSRKQLLQPVIFDVNQSIREMSKMLQRVIGEDIELETRLGESPVRCKTDPGQIEQAMLNLVVNARDAMPRGGKLTIEARQIALDQEHCRLHPNARPGEYVRISVTDTGSGMSPEVLARVFEPFFTTKAAGSGTGLGLAMVYGTVQQSGGHVEVRTQPGRGSTFTIYLPATDDPATDRRAAAAPAIPASSRTETVLLVEDEKAVRELTSRVLTAEGFTVLSAADGPEALRLAGAPGQAIDILVTDVVMPGQSGPDLAQALRASRPGLPVLFVSGHTDDAVVRHGLLNQTIDFLSKPYVPADLSRKVRDILGQESAPRPAD
ncbi:MAG: periplasmic sensor hybrid histidine kinase [Myxococcaceae bacterium]|nr:periplasmic sensor hybrid histidine kinase [Myxococcaceae bacterium]